MATKYRNYTHEQVKSAVKESLSLAEVLRKIDLRTVGGNYLTIKRLIRKLNLDTSHFLGQKINTSIFQPVEKLTKSTSIKRVLIKKHGRHCWKCKNTHWLKEPIALELEHKDGNRENNKEENLEMLCPNCHAQTSTYRRSKKSLTQYKFELEPVQKMVPEKGLEPLNMIF